MGVGGGREGEIRVKRILGKGSALMDTLSWTVLGHCLSLPAKDAKVALNDLICFALVQNGQPHSQDLVPLNRTFSAFPLCPPTLSAHTEGPAETRPGSRPQGAGGKGKPGEKQVPGPVTTAPEDT